MATTRNTTSRKPRTAARAASRPATSRARVEDPGDEVTEADAQEIEAEGHYVTASLCGEDVRIIPPTVWRMSWQRLLNNGEVDAFAERVLHPDDLDLLDELDPTVQEFRDFIQDAAQQAGEAQGNSRGPAPSSKRTRKR